MKILERVGGQNNCQLSAMVDQRREMARALARHSVKRDHRYQYGMKGCLMSAAMVRFFNPIACRNLISPAPITLTFKMGRYGGSCNERHC